MAGLRYFLRLGDITGPVAVKGFKGQIELLSVGWGAAEAGAGHSATGGGAGKVTWDPLSFVATSSIATPMILLACASGRHLPDAVITARAPKQSSGPPTLLLVTLHDVVVSSVATLAVTGETPQDEVSLSFGSITVEQADGAVTVAGGWDTRTNRAL